MRDIPVVDLFAGPGGLSFGFSAFSGPRCSFRIALSIEKDPIAYQTLLLRAFVRQFKQPPEEYYEFVRQPDSERLARLRTTFAAQWRHAEQETKCWELGRHSFEDVSRSISYSLNGANNWVLLGGPPCQAYSLAGRSRMKNRAGFAKDHRHTLYKEYLKVVAVHQPAIFVMENVKGILSSRHGARSQSGLIFQQILSDLRDPTKALREDSKAATIQTSESPGYSIYSFASTALVPELLRPEDYIIRSEEWGVPQRRHRVILLGVRNDLFHRPKTLSDFFDKETSPIESVIGSMPRIRSRVSRADDEEFEWRRALRASISASLQSDHRQLARLMVSTLRSLTTPRCIGALFIRGKGKYKPRRLSNWLWDERLGGVIQHEGRSHMAMDIARYFFLASFGSHAGRSPTLGCFPKRLLPKHKNIHDATRKDDFADRFRVQIKGQPSTTITSHISKDGNYYVHYDPKQCRSLTVREAARLQTFPDSYFFFGGRTAQYHQVGNAVPPLLASKLAVVVADLLERNEKVRSDHKETSEALA